MDFYDTDFNADDARGLVRDTRSEKDKMYHRIHNQIVLKVKKEAEKGRLYTSYKVPLSLPSFTRYDPEKVLMWLIKRLEKDGFKLQVDFRLRRIIISWAKVSSKDGLGPRPKTPARKTVRFKVPQQNVFQW